jgi:hypothetical protein
MIDHSAHVAQKGGAFALKIRREAGEPHHNRAGSREKHADTGHRFERCDRQVLQPPILMAWMVGLVGGFLSANLALTR